MITVHGSGRSHGRTVSRVGAVAAEEDEGGAAARLVPAEADRRQTGSGQYRPAVARRARRVPAVGPDLRPLPPMAAGWPPGTGSLPGSGPWPTPRVPYSRRGFGLTVCHHSPGPLRVDRRGEHLVSGTRPRPHCSLWTVVRQPGPQRALSRRGRDLAAPVPPHDRFMTAGLRDQACSMRARGSCSPTLCKAPAARSRTDSSASSRTDRSPWTNMFHPASVISNARPRAASMRI